MNLTPEQRGTRWPWNFVEAPLPESMPKDSEEGRTSRGYKDTRSKFEEENRHVERHGDVQLHIDAASI